MATAELQTSRTAVDHCGITATYFGLSKKLSQRHLLPAIKTVGIVVQKNSVLGLMLFAFL